MDKIVVTQSGTDRSYLVYLYHTLNADLPANTFSIKLSIEEDRAFLFVDYQKNVEDILRKTLLSCAEDIIGIGYKYSFLKHSLSISGLSEQDKEVLLTSLVAADLTDEKKYMSSKISFTNDLCLDGIFLFRLRALKEKWEDIVELLPESFTSYEFEKFVSFLLEGERKKIYIKGDEVFDDRYKKLRKSYLIRSSFEFAFQREVLLSGAGNICCLSKIKREYGEFLKKYYSGRIVFS